MVAGRTPLDGGHRLDGLRPSVESRWVMANGSEGFVSVG